MDQNKDTIDLWLVGRTLRREVRWAVGGISLGLAVALLGLWLLRPQYQGTATVLLRTDSEQRSSSMAMLSGLNVPGLSDMLPGMLGSGMETELQILSSRAVLGAVVDSLYLQARMRQPRDLPVHEVFEAARFDPRLPRGTYDFRRTEAGYAVEGPSHRGTARPGEPYTLPGAVVTLRSDLPDRFRVQLMRREKALEGLEKRLIADEAGGDVASILYKADNPELAASVPNAIVEVYLERKRTTDRGLNQHRYEFMAVRVDSVGQELALVEDLLRAHQERSGVFNPEVVGELQYEGLMTLRASLEQLQVESRGLAQIIREAGAGRGSSRQFAAYPTLLQSPAVNELVSQLAQLETRLTELQERRTERDPEVIGLQNSLDLLEAQFASLATSYLAALNSQETELLQELAGYQRELAVLPEHAQESFRLERDLRRLTQTQLALHAQMLDARIAAIGEGGEIRQIDTATPPDERTFPRPLPTLAIGLFGGLLLGVVSALSRGALATRIRDAHDAEAISGVPTIQVDENSPLLLGGLESTRTVLVLPVGGEARAELVAQRIASTASHQGRAVTLMNLHEPSGAGRLAAVARQATPGNGGPAVATRSGEYMVYRIFGNGDGGDSPPIRPLLEELEQESTLVVAALPSLEHPDSAAVLSSARTVVLAARAGTLQRRDLEASLATLRRLGIGVSGIVLMSGQANGRHRA